MNVDIVSEAIECGIFKQKVKLIFECGSHMSVNKFIESVGCLVLYCMYHCVWQMFLPFFLYSSKYCQCLAVLQCCQQIILFSKCTYLYLTVIFHNCLQRNIFIMQLLVVDSCFGNVPLVFIFNKEDSDILSALCNRTSCRAECHFRDLIFSWLCL